jgi:hypothetical protein
MSQLVDLLRLRYLVHDFQVLVVHDFQVLVLIFGKLYPHIKHRLM